MPPLGAVMELCGLGVPAICTVLVVGLMEVWAFAMTAASTKNVKRYKRIRVDLFAALPVCSSDWDLGVGFTPGAFPPRKHELEKTRRIKS